MSKHYKEQLSLQVISQTFGYSTFYISRNLCQVTGATFKEYIHQLKVKEAQRLLIETKAKVIDITVQTGFEDISHY